LNLLRDTLAHTIRENPDISMERLAARLACHVKQCTADYPRTGDRSSRTRPQCVARRNKCIDATSVQVKPSLKGNVAPNMGPDGSPPLTTNHPSDVPCPLPRRLKRVRVSISSRLCSLPQMAGGSAPHCHFRRLLRPYSRYGPSDRSAAQRWPLSRGSSLTGCPAKPLVSFRTYRQLSGSNLPPLMLRAFSAHCQFVTHAPQQRPIYSITSSARGDQRRRYTCGL